MDIAALKREMAGMFETLFVLDPLTGLPTAQPLRANAQAPMSLAETDLPTFILFTGAATYPSPPDQTTDRLAFETRDFTVCLYVVLATAGIDGESERKVEPYLNYTRNLIQSHPLFYDGQISDRVPWIMRAYLTRDDGITTLQYGNQKYLGLRFIIRVEGRNVVNYGNE